MLVLCDLAHAVRSRSTQRRLVDMLPGEASQLLVSVRHQQDTKEGVKEGVYYKNGVPW